ncbi:MAG: deoxynucleoside kinase [Halobacteriovoraceae bacterium]|nr:deoxynucleoside kinase [Halobacteriovoraceae bacterium]
MENNKKTRLFLVVAGNIGSGKTTLTQRLAERLNLKPFFESVEDNPYLKDFYSDMDRWSFPLQVYFLTHRFRTHKDIELSNSSSIQDRSIYEDAHIFARALHEQGNLDKRDYESYQRLYKSMTEHLDHPTLMIFLRRSLPKLQERIKMRGRDYEQSISLDYLGKLNKYYDEWFENYRDGKCLLVDTDDLDFMENQDHFETLVKKIFESIDQQDLFFRY